MIERLTITSVLLALSALIQQPEGLSPAPASIVSQQWRILRLARKRADGFHFVGTGFVITRSTKTYIVTCAHVVDNSAAAVPLYADFPYPMNAHRTSVLATDSESDLALLTTDVQIRENTEETNGEAKEGMKVFVIGFDDHHMEKDNPQIQSGVIRAVGWWEERGHRVFTSRRTTGSATRALLIEGSICQPGDSGSPVFAENGEVLAVTTAFTHDHSCLATATPALIDLLEQTGTSLTRSLP
jgi:S1-C subfamily serine protease